MNGNGMVSVTLPIIITIDMDKRREYSWHEAWHAMLHGEHIDGKRVGIDLETFLRRMAFDNGYGLVVSGTGSYKSYFIENPIKRLV